MLGSASGASLGSLGVGGNIVKDGTFGLHGGEVDIRTHGVLVSAFTRVEARSIRRVTFEGFEWVEVVGGARGVRIPGSIN